MGLFHRLFNKIKFKREENRWENNPFAQLVLLIPASIISSILIIPCIILSLPLMILPTKLQKKGVQFLLRVQNTISLSFWYFVKEFYFPDVFKLPFYIDILIVLIVVYFGFNKFINKNVDETLAKQGFV
tara:strand:- start:1602 stop:1988 length:387 start_codon:yes stop_codon:yes gene_type:complete